MMFGHNFYHGTLRRYVIMFGDLFNELTVDRFDSSGNKVQTINLPIAYGPKQKWLARIEADPDLNRPLSITLPRLGFTLNSMSYAPMRKLNSGHKIIKKTGSPSSVFVPVPYDLDFSLHVMVKNAEDGVQIIEQIIPFFTPDFTVTVHALPEMGIKLDVPIELTSVSSDDSYEGDFESRRLLTWQLDFTVKAYLFGPVNTSGSSYVSKVTINLNDDSQSLDDPKLVWKAQYDANSEFGFTETITDYSE